MSRTDYRRLNRRQFIKSTAAVGAGVAMAPLYAPHIRAAETIKIGYVARRPARWPPSARPTSASSASSRAEGQGLDIGGKNYAVEIIVKDSQSNPNRAGEVAKRPDPQGQGRPDAGRLARPRPPTRCRRSASSNEVPCISTVAPWQPWFFGRRAAIRPGASTGHVPLLLGPRGRHRRLHQHVEPARRPTRRSAGCSPTTATATPGATRTSASRRRSPRQGFTLVDPGRYQNLTDDFRAQIAAFKDGERRDRHRRGDPARLHDLLDAGAPAGLQAEGRHASARRCCSRSRSRRSASSATACPPRSGGAHPSRSSRR